MKFVLAFATATLLLPAATGGAMAQAEDPSWAGEIQTELERGAETHNAWVEREDPEFVGDRLAENEQAEVTVRDENGAEAVYTVATDREMRVTDVSRGPTSDESVRVFASKPALERALRAENPAAAVGDAMAAGDIRVERVVGVAGHRLALGPTDGLVGLLGFGASAALVGVVGVGTLLSLPGLVLSRGLSGVRAALRRLLGALGTLLDILAKLVTAVSAMELLGFGVREKIQTTAERLRARARAAGARVRNRLAELDEMPEAEDRGRGGETSPQSEESQ